MNKELTSIYIIGHGGFGKEVHCLLDNSKFSFQGYVDDDANAQFKIADLGFHHKAESAYCLALGDSILRKSIVSRLPIMDLDFPMILGEKSIVQEQESIKIGKGTIVCNGSILTCDIRIGNFCIVNLNCTIGHDCVLEDFVSLMPSVNLGGNVYLEEGVYIGTNATILPGVRIGAWSIIGAGAVVTRNVPPKTTVIGIPAKEL